MTKETLYRVMGDIDETYIAEAYTDTKPKYRALRRWGAVAAVLCLLVGSGLLLNILSGGGLFGNNGGFFGDGDATVFAAHREDFSPAIDNAVLAQFENPDEVKKAYLMRTNEWFLADDLTDFSQAITTDTVYVALGSRELSDTDTAYSLYDVDETGTIQWDCTAYPSDDVTLPSGFSGLTDAVIAQALENLAHEDYIITYAPRISTVFIWVRGTAEGDVILTYPTRPDLLGLECGGAYTLDELQCALADAYHDNNTDFHRADHTYTHHTDTHHSNTDTDDRDLSGNHHTDDHQTQSETIHHFTDSMGCSDQSCTNPDHFHDCDDNCTDPAHYHACDVDCRIEAHHHPKQDTSGHHTDRHNNHH